MIALYRLLGLGPVLASLAWLGKWHAQGEFTPIVAALLFVAVVAWIVLFRYFFELCVEVVVWPRYRITGAGPGLNTLPRRGPVLVIANHACWWDPLFLAKVIPRPITPMMTSTFYDKWFLRPLMVHVFRTIRVPDKTARREAPELQEAIAALDRGECVVIFPEGYLRRKEEVPLRRFGRGAWEILRARPGTPVIVCWIEGSWGSYTSHFNGPPTQNKRGQLRHPIAVGLSEPITVPDELLAEHLSTRFYLMNRVNEARAHLQLPLYPHYEPSSEPGEAGESSISG